MVERFKNVEYVLDDNKDNNNNDNFQTEINTQHAP